MLTIVYKDFLFNDIPSLTLLCTVTNLQLKSKNYSLGRTHSHTHTHHTLRIHNRVKKKARFFPPVSTKMFCHWNVHKRVSYVLIFCSASVYIKAFTINYSFNCAKTFQGLLSFCCVPVFFFSMCENIRHSSLSSFCL